MFDPAVVPHNTKTTTWLEVTARAEQRLGAIRDLFGVETAVVTAPTDGVVIMLRRMHRVNLGDGLVQVAQRLA